MELWIRSQDREKLLKCNDIAISNNMINEIETIKFKGYKIVGYFDKNTEYEDLGTYETKERALEVLDEIHKCIVDKEVLDGNNNILTLANKNSLNEVKQILDRSEKIAVYEMPKE